MGASQAEVETGRTLDKGAVLTRGTRTNGTDGRTGWALLQAPASAAGPARAVPAGWSRHLLYLSLTAHVPQAPHSGLGHMTTWASHEGQRR